MKPPCLVESCERLSVHRGWCRMHYTRWLRHGDPQGGHWAQGEAWAYFERVLWTPEAHSGTWPGALNRGYGQLWMNGRNVRTHVIACDRAHGPKPSPELEVLHFCAQKPDCFYPPHLRWGTHRENIADKVRHGTALLGERNPQTKLTPSAVVEIRALREQGVSLMKIAERHGVSKANVRRIVCRETWVNL